MVINGKLSGTTVDLRPADAGDAEFTIKLRQDPVITRFLPRVEHSITDHIAWINTDLQQTGREAGDDQHL